MAKRPDIPTGLHPVEQNRVYLNTGATERIFKNICRWISGVRSGCIVYGPSRIGKTKAIIVVKQNLAGAFPYMTVLDTDISEHDITTENSFWRELLISFNHISYKARTASEKLQVTEDFIVEEAYKDPCRRVVIFIDEAQELGVKEYGYLRGLYNRITKRKVMPLFILMGDEELINNYLAYNNKNLTKITGRFMNEVHKISGVKNLQEVNLILNGYDSTEYPDGSGWSCTRYYFTRAYDNGWRLSSQSKKLWDAFQGIQNNNKRIPNEIYMTHFSPAVNHILRTMGDVNNPTPIITINDWEKALLFVGIDKFAFATKAYDET
ncbi:ATP-binding protein [bacterium]|nr:ATP-binding protein [bacterium]